MITEQISVMVIESQPIMRTALSMALSSDGMKVVAEVIDNRDILPTVSNLTPDLILFSMNASSLKELEMLSILRQRLPNSLIVALVAGEFRGQFQAALDYGAHLALTKFTPRSELLTAIKRMAEQRIYPVSAQVN